jgi:carboxypeptidase T
MKTPRNLLVLLVFLTMAAQAQNKISAVKIYTPVDRIERAKLIGLLEIDHFQETPDGAIVSEINDVQVAKLKRTSFRHEILIDDVARSLETVNKEYYERRAKGLPTAENRMAFEQTGRTVDKIIAKPSAFVVQGTFGGYYSFAQIEAAINTLVSTYPAIAKKTSLGRSTENRDIWCIKISDEVNIENQENEPQVLFMGLQHAREAIGGSSMLFLMQYLCENYTTDQRVRDLVNNREIYIVPCFNPDGWEYNRTHGGAGSGWRKNRSDNPGSTFGVDLNRNWGIDWGNCGAPIIGPSESCGTNDPSSDTYYGSSPFSEPETRAIRDFTFSHHLTAMLDQHSYGPYYSLPFGRPSLPGHTMLAADDQFYTYISSAMGNYNGMRSGNSPQALGYEVAGGVKDWMLKGDIGATKGKVYGLTGEGGAGGGITGSYGSFWAPAEQIVNLCKGMVYQDLQLIYAAGSYASLQDKSDINLTAKTGTLDFSLLRVGLENKPISVSVIPMENIQTVGSTVTVSTLTSYHSTFNGSINYTLPVALTNGQRLRFAWKIETGGYTYYDTVTKFYNAAELLNDNMEGANVATKWTVTGGWNYTTEDAFSDSKSLTESPGGNYTANSTRRATYVNSFDLRDATAAWLSFWVKHRAENFYDKMQVMISFDGTNWTAIPGTTTIQEPGTLDGSTIDGDPSLTGIKEDWTRELFDLGGYLGRSDVRLRFEFTSGPHSSYDFSEDDGFHIDNLKVIKSSSPLITLPVHFISFRGRLQENETVRLEWDAATDDQHDHFEVERSADGTHFISLGRGPAAAPYWKIDPSPVVGNNFYRIKQFDKNGDIAYSQVINIQYDPAFGISVFPNPVYDVLTVKVNTANADRYTISLVDLEGKKVMDGKVITNAMGSGITINMKHQAAQTYILIVRNEKNIIVATRKIAKE